MTVDTAIGTRMHPSAWQVFRRNRMSVVGLWLLVAFVVVALLGSLYTPFDPNKVGAGARMVAPNLDHPMGTDELGRDIFSRVLEGMRTSLLVGLSAAAISTFLGIVVGSLSGFIGRWIDDALMRLTEVFQIIPRFFLAMMLVSFFGPSIFNIVLAIALLSWPELARVVRSEFLSLRSRQYVDAARVAGASDTHLVFVQILPNALGPAIVNATLLIGQAILLEAGLSYLGLGDRNQISLGVMLFDAQYIMRSAWWATAFPGMMIFVIVLAMNLLGDGLNDVLNPRSRNR